MYTHCSCVDMLHTAEASFANLCIQAQFIDGDLLRMQSKTHFA